MGLKMSPAASVSHGAAAWDAGYGTQVRTERMDMLDASALEFISSRRAPIAVDLGCGEGEQAIAMALAGAYVAAIDLFDFAGRIRRRAIAQGVPAGAVCFRRADAADSRRLLRRSVPAPDVLYCQRMLHYLPYEVACKALGAFREGMEPGSRLYLGLSGIRSELGRGYSHGGRPVQRRFCALAPCVGAMHRIAMPICLYGLDDAYRLVRAAGFSVLSAQASAFGNLKLVAEVI